MGVFEITIQHKTGHTWPVVVRHKPGAGALTRWSRGTLHLDLATLDRLLPTDRQYGTLLGQALFQEYVRDAFVAAAAAATRAAPLRVLLIVEAGDLRDRHWQQLCAPLDRRWSPLLLNQRTPFSLYLPAEIDRRYPPIGRRDLRALILVAGPEDLDGNYNLAPFDIPATVRSIRQALGDIPSQVLASVDGAGGPPTLRALLRHLTAGGPSGPHTLLHIVCHGSVEPESAETVLYLPQGGKEGERRPVPATMLIQQLHNLDNLPYLTLLSACESAHPEAETGLGGAAQRLVRELGTPAVLAMTGRISIDTAGALSTAFYERLNAQGEVDLALAEALAGLQGRPDVTIPALFSRLAGRPLWSDDLDRPLTGAEIEHGLDRLGALLPERAPILLPEYETQAGKLRATLGAATNLGAEALSAAARQEHQAALAGINTLCGQALDLSFNALALGEDTPAYDDHPPFRGLLPFRAEHARFFFGRQPLVQDLSQRLAQHPFLAVLGPSGSGKSSLVLAGLLPTLQAREPDLQMAYLTPGSDPVSHLEAALAAASIAATSGSGSDSEPPPPLVIVDQFEETFTQCDDPAQRQVFARRLLDLLPSHRLILTMRADFWGDCATLGDLKDQMLAHQELVAPLDAAGLRRAMERQADAVGLRFEAGLGQQILEDVRSEPGAMPLLQHALLLLWNRRHGRWLRWGEYRAFGGIQGAIAHTADEFFDGLGVPEQDRLREIMLRLTRLGDAIGEEELRLTRRRMPLSELVPAGDDPAGTQALVQRLADERLLVTTVDEVTGQPEVEVAHEALIQHWPRLRAWLKEDPELARLRQELGAAARAWRDRDQDDSYLLTGTRLEDIEVLHRQNKLRPTRLEQRYLSACAAFRERRQRVELEQARALAEQERLRAEAEQERAEAAHELAKEQEVRANVQAQSAHRLRRRAIILAVVLGIAVLLAVAAGLSAKVAVDNAATATANLALAEANEAEANMQRATATANLALAVTNEAEANRQKESAEANEAEANAQRATAVAHAKLAHARELAGQSAGNRDGKLDLALLLGIEGFRRQDLPQTREALFETWRHNPQLSQFLHGHSYAVMSLAWSKDGQLASGSTTGTIILWDLEHHKAAQILEGNPYYPVSSLAWSSDGRLASGSLDRTIILWDLEHGVPDCTLEGHSSIIESIAWSKSGQLASGSSNGTIILWDLERCEPAQILKRHFGYVTSLAWSTDGRLASGSSDGTVILWDVERGVPEQTLEANSTWVTNVAWSTDGQLASGSTEGTIILWDLENGSPDKILTGNSSGITDLAWLADGQLASGSNRTAILWDLERGQPSNALEGLSESFIGMAWSADGQLATGSVDGVVTLWDLERHEAAQILKAHSAGIYSVAWSADGRLASGADDNTVILWNLQRSEAKEILEGHAGRVTSLAWSADGRLASGSWDHTVVVWDLEQGVPDYTLKGDFVQVNSLAWSADGLLASSSLGTIILWDLERGEPHQILEEHSNNVTGLAWSPDGRLASSSEDGTVILWDLERGRPDQTLEGHSGAVGSLAWSPDGRLASGSWDRTITLWDLESGKPGQILEGHSDIVSSLAWSTDGRLASRSEDGTVILWDLERGVPGSTPERHLATVSSVAWSADGRLASGSRDGTVRVWRMDPNVWETESCQRAGRNLTQTEWTLYLPNEPYRKTCDQWPPGQ